MLPVSFSSLSQSHIYADIEEDELLAYRDSMDRQVVGELSDAIEIQHAQHTATRDSGSARSAIHPLQLLTEVATGEKNYGVDVLEVMSLYRNSYDMHKKAMLEQGIDVSNIAKSMILLDTLTEDNLPHYTTRITQIASGSEAFLDWAHTWTAEEDAHGVIMRDLALFTGIYSPHRENDEISFLETYENGRESQLRSGMDVYPLTIFHALSYLSLQELLTYDAHHASGRILCNLGRKVLDRVANDESRHHRFYRNLLKSVTDMYPDKALIALDEVITHFAMPGRKGIPQFDQLSLDIALSGAFDLVTQAGSVKKILGSLNIEDIVVSSDLAKRAQQRLVKRFNTGVRKATTYMNVLFGKGREQAQILFRSGKVAPYIVGYTVDESGIALPYTAI